MLQAFKDAAVVAEDAADVAAQFTNVPDKVVKLTKDAVLAAYNRDPIALTAVITEADSVFATIKADGCQASSAIQQFQADLKQLLSDLS